MEFVKAMKIRVRICKYYGGTSLSCDSCPLSHLNNGVDELCDKALFTYSEEMEKILEKWDKEHPVKLIRDDFHEKFPKARVREDGITPRVCAYDLGYVESCPYLTQNCKKCWQTPMEV